MSLIPLDTKVEIPRERKTISIFYSLWMVLDGQVDFLGFVSEIIACLEEVKSSILPPTIPDLYLGIFLLEVFWQLNSLENIYILPKYFPSNPPTLRPVQVNLLIGGFPEALILIEMPSPSITVKFPWEDWNSGASRNIYN